MPVPPTDILGGIPRILRGDQRQENKDCKQRPHDESTIVQLEFDRLKHHSHMGEAA